MSLVESGKSSPPTLLEQAEGLERKDIMRRVAGPVIDKLLRPLLTPDFTGLEVAKIPAVSTLFQLNNIAGSLHSITFKRVMERQIVRTDAYRQLGQLSRETEVFYISDIWPAIDEGIRSGFITPLKLASRIDCAEKGVTRLKNRQGVKPGEIAAIMHRPVFGNMLHVLARGQNGFLRNQSSRGSMRGDKFFDFKNVSNGKPLQFSDAFAFDENGQVTGFSNAYYLAANEKRKFLREAGKHGANSSGCPVRHRQVSDRDSLITVANEFAVAGLKISAQK